MVTNKDSQIKFAILATDTCLFAYNGKELLVRLINVNRPPYFVNMPGLPGGLILPNETVDQASKRHLLEKGNVSQVYTEQLYTFSDPNRDPRGRVVAVGYLALSNIKTLKLKSVKNKFKPEWVPINKLPKLAYDHQEIIAMALKRLQSKLEYTNIAFALLPKEFTLTDLQNLYEVILETSLDKRNFRKKVLSLDMIKEIDKKDYTNSKRPAQLFSFKKQSIKFIKII